MARLGAPKVWIDDAHPIFRRGLATCLVSQGFDVVGESAGLTPPPNGHPIDVLLFEAEAHGLHRAVRATQARKTRLIALVHQPSEQLVSEAVAAGVAAVLLRSQLNARSLGTCVNSVVNGNAVLPTELLNRVLDRAAKGARHTSGGLTGREVKVLRLLAEGGDTREIADELAYSERTVKNVVHDVLVKMNCRNRAHAVAHATRQGVI
jgi:DNA-binding NarL/FixJ family response regulator